MPKIVRLNPETWHDAEKAKLLEAIRKHSQAKPAQVLPHSKLNSTDSERAFLSEFDYEPGNAIALCDRTPQNQSDINM